MEEKKQLRIVIADDEAVIRMGLKHMIAALGHRVVGTATNGDEAFEMTKRLKPDLLLLDIKMPITDGLTVAEALATEIPLPIVMLTAYSERSLIERAANASVMGYLVKPIHENKLGPTIEVAIARFSAMRAVAQEAYQLRDQLEARKAVDAAKKILVATGISEEEAYKRLQMTARRKRCTMHQVAEAIIAIGEKI
jgi:response regulator NasT